MRTSLPPLNYDNTNDNTLKQALHNAAQQYLQANNEHRYANLGMFIKLITLVFLCGTCYIMALNQNSIGLYFLCYFLFITMAMLLAINVVHDASHNVFFKSRQANTWLNRFVTLPLGIDPDCWRVRHVEQHHPFSNVEYYDLDIDYNGFLRQTPFQPCHWFMRYQHYYWPVIAGMTFPTIIWCFDWQDRLGLKFNKNKFAYNGLSGWSMFLIAKFLHISLTIILPIILCPQFSPGLIVIIYLLSQMCSSLTFVILILGTHWAKATFYQAPDNNTFTHGSTQHTFNTTLNWRFKSEYIEYWLGGLNLHLTHHIYPGFSHRHYQKLTKIIQDITQQYNIDYQEITVSELFIYQQKFLKEMGRNNKKQ